VSSMAKCSSSAILPCIVFYPDETRNAFLQTRGLKCF
jgi:hypothetical protein